MKPLLAILNPRRIPECLESYRALTTIDRVWLSFFTEHGIGVVAFPQMLAEARRRGYTHILVVSDDGIVFDKAVLAVLDLLAEPDIEVATGYSNLDNSAYANMVNLSAFPLISPSPIPLDTPTRTEVQYGQRERYRTYFAGMTLTGMSVDMWERYPFAAYGSEPGHASDYHLSWRLQCGDVPMWAPRDGFVFHVKAQWNAYDELPGRGLLVGTEPPKVVWDPLDARVTEPV